MPGVFSKKPRMLLGLDIGSTSVKLLELGGTSSRYQVEVYAIEPLPANALVERAIVEPELVARAVSRLVTKAHARSRHVAVAVSGPAVITRMLDMPAGLSADELEIQLRADADQYIPYPLDDVALDFHVIGTCADNPGRVNVLVAACRRERVELLEAVLDLAGLVPAVVDVEAHAWQRAVTLLSGTQRPAVALIDIGTHLTTLHVLSEGLIVFSREHLFGGRQLAENIQRQEGRESEPVVRMEEGSDGCSGELHQPSCEALLQQISRSLQWYIESDSTRKVERVLLAGGGASIDGLAPMIERCLKVPTQVANPFTSMTLAARVNPASLADAAPALMIACGLALRSFD